MAEKSEKDIEGAIAERLREAGLKFATEKGIGGLAADFIVQAPDGRQFIVQTRHWDFPGLTTEASRQAQFYQEAAKVDGAFVVIPGLKRSLPAKGVVSVDGLVPAIQAELESAKTRTHPAEATRVEKLIFAAMPFAPQYEDVFFVAMSYAAEQVGAVCDRVDRREFQGNVVEEIHRMIRKAVAVIVVCRNRSLTFSTKPATPMRSRSRACISAPRRWKSFRSTWRSGRLHSINQARRINCRKN